jgi:glycosyltransferase involved in cell wall biosynthesis
MAQPTPFTVGIPVYNEEAILVSNTERLLAFLDALGREYEVIIGSNGSTDSTTAIGVDLSRRFAHVSFFHIPERGVGLAFREFVARARYPLLVSADMDLSVDLSFISEALVLLDSHEIVVGSKKLGNQKRSWLRKFGSDTFLRIAKLLLGMDYEDYSIAAKAYRVETLRRFIDRINFGSSYVIEICYLTHRSGGRVIQIPVSCEDWRVSKFNLLNEAVYKYTHLVRLWLRHRRTLNPPVSARERAPGAPADRP